MNETLITIFTGVAAVATVAYTIVTVMLLKATKASADAARASADAAKVTILTSYLQILAAEAEKQSQTNPQVTAFLNQLATLMAETAITRFMEDIELNEQPLVRDVLNKIDGLFRAHGVNMQSIPALRPVAEKLKSRANAS